MNPISPEELKNTDVLMTKFPEYVIEAFNQAIINFWDGKLSKVPKNYVINLIKHKSEISRQEILSSRLLDIEPLYESKGWKVYFEKGDLDGGEADYFYFSLNQK